MAVRNYRQPEDPGTVIEAEAPAGRGIAGLADMPSMTVFTVPDGHERTPRRVRELLAQARLNFQALTVHDGSWKFAVKREKYRDVGEVAAGLLRPRGLEPTFEDGQWALVTLVGEGLRDRADAIAPRVAAALAARGVGMEGDIRDTLSYSVLVREEQRRDAILTLHEGFVTFDSESAPAAG